ncbi:myo-inosose-2 dehydratase [Cohnella panacarvi]|uniref:myo-inosose-2 dehydratase n=1 Tax=Cohnella panacarvi TaxID=400776 RepID=UPI00047A6F1C|nr:myo-inosose-2 dehydratase [Cohnella panacarvi]
MKYTFGISAINWVNEDVLEVGDWYTCDDVLSDMSRLGFKGTEYCRKFPRDTGQLASKLKEYGMVLTSQWKSVLFSDPQRREAELQAFREHADFLKEMGCGQVVVCEVAYAFNDPVVERRRTRTALTDEEWQHMVDGLHAAGTYCRDNGMKLVYHYHAETVVESPEQIRRLMDSTDPRLVHMLYDTGHTYYGGSDPLELLRTYYDRIAYIHLKDVRQNVREWKRDSGTGFTDAVVKGLFTVPGDGCIDFGPIMRELDERGYDGWIILEAEQNPAVADPVEYAQKAKQYLSI